eukprot:gene9272-12491_t
MDIRNFFNGTSGKNAKSTSAVDKKDFSIESVVLNKKKLIVEDDEEELDFNTLPSNEDVKKLEKENITEQGLPDNHKTQTVPSPKPKLSNNSIKSPIKSCNEKLFANKKEVIENDQLNTSVITSTDTNNNNGNGSATIAQDLASIITWKEGEHIPYIALVDTFESISSVSGRIEKENYFAKLYKAVIVTTPQDLDSIIYLSSNNVFPAYEGMELGIGDSLLVKAICQATGRNKQSVEEDYEREGDLGIVALLSRASQKTLSFASKPKPLQANFVLEQFRLITQVKGSSSQSRKVDIIKSLMIKCQGPEAKYIIRALQGKLRIGTAEQTVLVSLAHAFAECPTSTVKELMKVDRRNLDAEDSQMIIDNDDDKETDISQHDNNKLEITVENMDSNVNNLNDLIDAVIMKETPEALQLRKNYKTMGKEAKNSFSEIAIKRAYSEHPNLSTLVKAGLEYPIYKLFEACRLTIGIPVAPMLAKPTKKITEVLKRLSGLAFTMEYKYDGERAQVHLKEDGTVKIFSRNSEDNSEKYPDLKDVIRRACKEGVKSCIVDAEVVAYDREKGCLLPFQVLSTRKRKVDSGEEENQKVKVVLQGFDLLYINGKSLLRETLRTRRTLLHQSFQTEDGFFHFASGMDHVEDGDTTPIEGFLQEACGAMCEGLMVKTLDNNASYEPSKRSLNWLKLKKDYIDGMGVCDSVDLVVVGAYLGRGKRVNTYGAYLMACYDPERDEFQSVCKVGTGLKDEDLQRLHEQMQPHIIPSHRKPINYNVDDTLNPDVWFNASVVLELQAADLSKSSKHTGGVGRIESGRGIGLRFPRYVRDRPDKKPENATSAEQIVEMYYSQGGTNEGEKDNENGDDDDDDDCI